MAVNPQKLLPGSSSSAIVKGTIKTSAISKSLKSPSSAIVKVSDAKVVSDKPKVKAKDPSLSIYKKVVKIDKLLKNNFKFQSKKEESRKKESETKKKESREKELETPKKFKGFAILKNALPKTGILDAVKRFIIFTFAGWAFGQLFKFLPKLLDIIKIIAPIYSWFEKGIGMLFEGFVAFIDFGYKAYDSVRDFAKKIGGENFEKTFDDFSSNLNKFLNLAITAAMISAAAGGFGGGRGGRPPIGSRVTPKGRPTITTSGGRPAGRPDLRNPIRQRPAVTTSGGGSAGRPDLRNPIRQRPTVTTSGGKPAGKFQFPRGAGGLTKGARGIIGVGTILDLGVRIASGQPVSKAVVGAAGGAIGAGIGTWLGGAIGGVAGSVVPIIGNFLLGGAGATIGGILGGMIGGGIADALYDTVTGYGKERKIQKKETGGLVRSKIKKPPVVPQRRKNKIQFSSKKITNTKIQPGKDVGGKKKIEKLYPNPENKLFGVISIPGEFSWLDFIFGGNNTQARRNIRQGNIPNALKALVDTGEVLGKSGDWVGALMRAGIQVALGEVPDVKSIASAITQVIDATRSPAINGIETIRKEIQKFADGGLVSKNSVPPETNSLILERALEGTIKKRVDNALNSVRKEVRKRGPTGRDEMLDDNRSRATDPSAGPGGPPGPGGGPGGGQTAVTGNINEKALLDLLATAEGTTKSYGVVSGGDVNKDLESGKLTVREVIALGNSFGKPGSMHKWSGATGRYQFMPSTLQNLINKGVLKPNDKFTPEMQDKAALALAIGRGVDPSKPLTENDIYKLGGEWASLEGGPGMRKGGSYSYGGRSQVKYNAKKALEIYQKNIKSYEEERSRPNDKAPKGGRVDKKNSVLNLLATTDKLDVQPSGYCVTAVLETLQKNGIPNPPATGLDSGNNPRGMMSQLINSYGWSSLPGAGSPIELKSPYGKAKANEMTFKQYQELVNSGKIPSGALVFQTRNQSWNGESLGSRGFDAAIARNGGRNLWNGYMNGDSIYSNTKKVIVLVPKTSIVEEPKEEKPKPNDKQKSLAQTITPNTKDELSNKGVIVKGNKFYKKGAGIFGTDMELEVSNEKNKWIMDIVNKDKPKEPVVSAQDSKREYDVILPLDHHVGNLPPKDLWPNASLGADGRERDAQGPTAEIIKRRLEEKGLRVLIMRPENYRTEDAYNKALVKYSQAGSVVSSLHYDAPSNANGIGFIARLGESPDKDDRDYANKLAPILQSMARESGGNQRYGGIDTEANITMRLAGANATAALIELGALVEQEKKYGKRFWENAEFIKYLNQVADATATSVKVKTATNKKPYTVGSKATLNGKPVVWNGNRWISSNEPSDIFKFKPKTEPKISSIFERSKSPTPSTPSSIFDWSKKQDGGFISPKKSNIPNVSSRAHYEMPGSNTMAILPIKTREIVSVPMGGGAIFDSFPVAGLNNNSSNSYGLMRG